MTSADLRRSDHAIAIIGMDCIFPGARDLAAYWGNIVRGVEAIREVSPMRWNSHEYAFTTRRGGFIDGLTEFDPLPFGIMPVSVDEGDPEQFLLLSVIHRALADARQGRRLRQIREGAGAAGSADVPGTDPSDREDSPLSGDWLGVPAERTEVVIGRGGYLGNAMEQSYLGAEVVTQVSDLLVRLSPGLSPEGTAEVRRLLIEAVPAMNAEVVASATPNLTSGRVTNRMGFMGANYTVDAACASALVAIDNVIRSLRAHRCDLGIAAGVHLIQKPHFWYAFERLTALSPSGRLRAFAAEADGLLIGEGIGAVVLKRRSDAERDGDRIYAIIRGVGVASDGRGAGVLTPRVEGEVLAIRRAYEDAGVDPGNVALIEGHGTGMPVGDATEVAALHQVFGKDGSPPVALGSVKSMIGHTMAAAGMAGLIKATLALYHRVLPPTLHAEQPHPALVGSRFYANTATRPWISSPDTPRRAGVNAFGFGGINSHVILEQSPAEAMVSLIPQNSELFLASAETRQGLLETLASWVRAVPALSNDDLRDIAFTASLRFSPGHAVRIAIVAASVADVAAKLARARHRLVSETAESWSDPGGIYFSADPRLGKVAFLFPATGFHRLTPGYSKQLAELCTHFAEVRRSLDYAISVTSAEDIPFLWDSQFFPPSALGAAAGNDSAGRELAGPHTPTAIVQLAIWSILRSRTIWSLLHSMGFRPDVFAGFSMGEWPALVAAGALTVEELISFRRFYSKEEIDAQTLTLDDGISALVATGADHVKAVLREIPGMVSLSMDASPTRVAIGGESGAVRAALQRFRDAGVWAQELPAPPIHTPAAAHIVEILKSRQSGLPVRSPSVPVYSGMDARLYPDDPDRIRDMVFEVLAAPVRTRDTILRLYADGIRIFVQLGSGVSVLPDIRETLARSPHTRLSIELEGGDGLDQLHHLVGQLAVLGVPFSPEVLFRHRPCRRLDPARGQPPKERGRVLPLHPPELRPSEDAVLRLREILAPTSPALPPRTTDGDGRGDLYPSPAGSPFDDAAATLGRFLHLQQEWEEGETRLLTRYLETQEAALMGFLSGDLASNRPVVAGPLEEVPALPVAEAVRADVSTVSGTRPAYPLVGEVLGFIPGRELTSRLTLDLDEHLFLLDHTLIWAPPGLKPPQELYPALPLAVGVEILAEAAAALVPDLPVRACHDVEAARWIILQDTRTLALKLTARRLSDTEVAVEIRGEGREDVALRGVITLGASVPPPPPSTSLSCDQPCPHTAQQLYSDGLMFHGPRFQVVAAFRGMTQNAIAADLEMREPQELFRSPLSAATIFPIALIDGLAQLVGYAALLDGRLAFPVRMGRIALHGSPPPPGSTAHGVVHFRKPAPRRVEADLDVFDPAGRLWLRIDGCVSWRPLVPWMGKTSSLAAPMRASDGRVRWYHMTQDLFEGMPPEGAARAYLIGEEWTRYQERPELPWLLGRVAAKDAVRSWLHRERGLALHPLEVRIASRPDGAPFVAVPAETPLAIAISHIEDEALAAAACARGVGVDLVRIADRGPEFLRLGFDEDERAAIAAAGGDARAWAHRAWSAKEAAAKAHGLGFEALPRCRVRRISPEDGTIHVESPRDGTVCAVETYIDRDRVMALAVIEGGTD